MCRAFQEHEVRSQGSLFYHIFRASLAVFGRWRVDKFRVKEYLNSSRTLGESFEALSERVKPKPFNGLKVEKKRVDDQR